MDAPITYPIPIRLAQTVGITFSTLLAGSTISMSTFLVPRILESPAPLLLKQWTNFFNTAKKVQPPLAIVAGGSYFYLAYDLFSSTTTSGADRGRLLRYAVAGLLSVGIVPYTILFLNQTNNKLLGMKDASILVAGESVHQLVDRWGVLNLVRGVMLTVSGALGVWTSLQ